MGHFKRNALWQHRLNNGAISPTNSAVVLENVWKLVQCVSPPGSVCTSKWQSVEMEAVRVSGTVTGDDQRVYIKIETLRGKTPSLPPPPPHPSPTPPPPPHHHRNLHNHCHRPDLLENGFLILHVNAWPHLGKDVRELLLPHLPYSPPDFDLFPKLKIDVWCAFLNAGGTFCLRYPTRQTAQQFNRPDGYHGPSKTLGSGHSAEWGLHWKTITLYRISGVPIL
jgi:hypothetical protein